MTQKNGHVYAFGPFELNPAEQQLRRNGEMVQLTPKVLAVLETLVENAGHLVGREELIRAVWPDTFVEDANVSRCVFVLRKALGEGHGMNGYIETVPKSGYRFIATVTVSAPAPLPPPLAAPAIARVPDDAVPSVAQRSSAARPGRLSVHLPIALAAGVGLASLSGFAVATWRFVSAPLSIASRSVAPDHRQVTFTGADASPAISPDGRYVAYVSDDPPSRHVTVREVAGGQPVTIASSTEAGMLRWSPDGSRLMFFLRGPDRNGIYMSSRTGGSLTQIAGGPHRSCWSPDGETIATVQPFVGRVRLLEWRSGATKILSLQGQHDWFWDIDWSSAGDRLLLVSQNAQRFTVLTVQTDGQNQRTVITDTREIPSARWAPRGHAIYYSRRVDQTASIFKVRFPVVGDGIATGSPLVTGLESDGFFEVSADGQRLTYARDPFFSNLWLVDINRGSSAGLMETRQLTRGTSQVDRPGVSPDGGSIVFTVGRESFSTLHVMPVTGGEPRQLTALTGFSAGGVWSPDGSQIAFASNEGGTRRIWITNTNGAPARAVSTGDVSDSLDVAWGHAAHLYYQQAGNRDFYVLDPARGQGETMLWQRGRTQGWVFSPVVSPDGRTVAVSWSGRGIWTLDTRTGQKTKLLDAEKAAGASPLAWSRDGQRLYLITGQRAAYRGLAVKLGETTKDTRVLSVAAAGGPVTTVAVLPFSEVGGVAMTPDGRRLVCAVYTARSDVWIVDHFDPDVSQVAVR
jgi:Tol biopolymer transport system component/DNA-binding winged helix-turn-helix (wHTH) protein